MGSLEISVENKQFLERLNSKLQVWLALTLQALLKSSSALMQ
jgi:type II secretory pathway component PulL